MAYPLTCEGARSAMKASAQLSTLYTTYAGVHIGDATVHWYAAQDHEAIQDIIFALSDLNTAAGYAGYGYSPFQNYGPWLWYMDNCIEAAEMTMDDILNVMLTADPEQVMRFTGLVDAYRQSVWDKPFNREFYAALARGFM